MEQTLVISCVIIGVGIALGLVFRKAGQEEKARAVQLTNDLSEQAVQLAKVSSERDQVTAQLKTLTSKYEAAELEIAELKEQHSQIHADLKVKCAELDSERKRLEAQQTDFEKQKQNLKDEFKSLSETILKERQDALKTQNDESVKNLLSPLEEQLKGFQQQVQKAHETNLEKNSSLETQIKNVIDMGIKMSDEANNLSTALKGKSQTRGAWGEAMLEQSLEMSGLQPETHYTSQTSIKDEDGKRKRPDFLIKVPGGRNLIIDSKVTLNAYDRLVAAETEEEAAVAMTDHIAAVKKHMDDLGSKSYDQIAGLKSPDFVLMFMPIEAAYIEALKHDKELYSYGYKKNIVLVSHTTLLPILRTVANLWKIDQANKSSKEIADKAGDIYNSIVTMADNVLRLGTQFETASKTYNKVVNNLTGQRGLYGKVERFSQLSEKVKAQLPDVEPKHIEIDTEKLEILELEETPQNVLTDESEEASI